MDIHVEQKVEDFLVGEVPLVEVDSPGAVEQEVPAPRVDQVGPTDRRVGVEKRSARSPWRSGPARSVPGAPDGSRPPSPDQIIITVALYGSSMSSETTSASDSDPAGDGALISLYREYFGEPESRRNVYIGFGLFFAGVGLGAVSLALFFYSSTRPEGSELFWLLREVALVFAMLALPAVATSIVRLLPVGRRTTAVSLAGVGLCVAATAWLTQVYPYGWTAGSDVQVVSLYAVGLVLLTASTGTALVATYLDRATAGGGGAGRVTEAEGTTKEAATDDGETVSEEQVAEDIADAMSDSDLSWGGVEQQPTTKRLDLDMPEPDMDLDESDAEAATETRSSGDDVDEAVAGLRQLQGGDQKTARAESPDEQVDALTEFRRQREEAGDESIETGVDSEKNLISRLREQLFD
jgi:hypothetical protein